MTVRTFERSVRAAASALEAGRVDDALSEYVQARALGVTIDEIFAAELGVVVCFARRRRWDDAVAALFSLRERHPESGIVRAYLGAARFERGEIEAAREELDEAVRIAPNDSITYVKRGEVFARIGMLREALADFQQAARLPNADDATLDYVRQGILKLRKDLDGAIERRVPPLPSVRRLLGRRVDEELANAKDIRRSTFAWRNR